MNAWETLGPRGALLRETLATAVPLRMAELRHADRHELIDWHRRTHQVDDQSHLLPHADVLLYGDKGSELTVARRALVDSLAVAALVADGGVTFVDLHFCTDHHHCMEATS